MLRPTLSAMIRTLINLHCELGENPLWNSERGCLLWSDITGGKLHEHHPASNTHRVLYQGPPVGGFTHQANGDLLLFRSDDVAVLKPDGRTEIVRTFKDTGMERFNDVIADPGGRVLAGTIGTDTESGGLYRLELDGSVAEVFRGTGVSNGMGFSPDQRTFYWTCSTRRRIYAFDYEEETGGLTHERILYQATEEEGIPDGMTVDLEGHIWSTRWDGFALKHHATNGRVLETFNFPVAKISSVCFGGPEFDQLFLTSAGGLAAQDTLDGAVFQLSLEHRGRPEFRSRIGIG